VLAERPGLRFGRVAEEYERVRPTYPAALVEQAFARAGLRQGDTVVEVGCGTGKLTRELTERGLVVEAVEPDAELIEVARRILPEGSVRFHNATLEDAELPAPNKAVFAATSFHWIDPAVGWQKVASLLGPGGTFALLSHAGGPRDELDWELIRVWHDVVPESAERWAPRDEETLWGGVESRLGNVSELWSWLTYHELARPEAAELFTDVAFAREASEIDLSTEDYLARLRTSNYYLHLAPEGQQRLDEGIAAVLDAHGGTYRNRTNAVLVTARRSA
jgi:SAM-dependent methyltransferase